MKKLFYKLTIAFVAVSILLFAVFLIGEIYLFNALLKIQLSPQNNLGVKSLINEFKNKTDEKELKKEVDQFFNNTNIISAIRFSKKDGTDYEYKSFKCSYFLKFFSINYPIEEDGSIVGAITIWPEMCGLLRSEVLAVLFLLFIILLLFIALLIYLFFYRNLFFPFQELKKFLDNMERNSFTPLETDIYGASWQKIAKRLNQVSDKLSNTLETLHMLFCVSRALTSRSEMNEIFRIVIEIIQRRFEKVSCSIITLEEDGFIKVNSQHGLSPDFIKAMHIRPNEGPLSQVFQKCQMIITNDLKKQKYSFILDILEKDQIESYIFAPLLVDNKCVGLLNVNSSSKNYFTLERVETISTLAEYLSIAIRNVKLYERVQELNTRLETEVSSTTTELIQTNSRLIQKVREMKALSDIASFAASKYNLPEIFDMIVSKIKELLAAQAAGFFLYSAESNELVPHAPFFGIKNKEFSRLHFKLSESKTMESVLRENKSAIINDTKQASEALPVLSNIFSFHSLCIVPLRSGNKHIGILGVANKFGSTFNKDDIRVVELIADRIAGVIENVTLYQEIEHRLGDLTTLQEISSAISSEPDLEKTIKKIITTTSKAFDADLCALLLFDEKSNELITQPGAYFTGGDESVLLRISIDDPNSISVQVFKTGEAFISPDASIDPRIKSQTARLWDVRSLLLVPLKSENQVIGVLRIGKHKANFYTKDSLRLANLIAHQAAVIIQNAGLYDSLREAKEEQERLNQVKNEFLSVVSHELRTPITAIKGFVKIVLQGDTGELNAQQKKFLQIADQSTDRLTVLISDLLDISRIESGQMNVQFEQIDMKELIQDVIKNITQEASKKKISLKKEFPEEIPVIMGDEKRLTQVFNNLIVNGIKFTPSSGEIIVSAQDKGDFILFGVKDSGIGIAPKEQQKIFDKFYQINQGASRSISGAGLGLAIVRYIIEIHGGHIWVESEPGKGSHFKFVLPRAKTEIKNFHLEEASEDKNAAQQ